MVNKTRIASTEVHSFRLIKSDLGRFLVHVDVLEEGSVHVVRLLLDSRAKLEKLIRYWLVGTLQDVDKPTTVS